MSWPLAAVANVGAATSGVTTSYDALGRITGAQATSKLGTLTTTTYPSGDLPSVHTNARGQTTATTYRAYDAAGRLTTVLSHQ